MNINEQTRHPKKGMAGGEQIRNSLFTGKEDNGNSFIMEHSYSAKEDFNWIKKKLLKIRLMTKNKEDVNQGFFVPSLS